MMIDNMPDVIYVTKQSDNFARFFKNKNESNLIEYIRADLVETTTEERAAALKELNSCVVDTKFIHDHSHENSPQWTITKNCLDRLETIRTALQTDDSDIYMKLPGSTTQPGGVMKWKNAYLALKMQRMDDSDLIKTLEQVREHLLRQHKGDATVLNTHTMFNVVDETLANHKAKVQK